MYITFTLDMFNDIDFVLYFGSKIIRKRYRDIFDSDIKFDEQKKVFENYKEYF